MKVPSDKIWVEVSQILRGAVDAEGEADASLFELEHDPYLRPDGPVSYKVHVELAGKDLIVTGEASAPMKLLCGRCGCFFSTTVKISAFLRAFEWDAHPEVLDLTEDIREDLLLEVPAYPLCRPDCRGLCPVCGQNLNEASCGCAPRPGWDAGSPWGALDGLDMGSKPQGGGPDKNE